jgi:hypothetical protein
MRSVPVLSIGALVLAICATTALAEKRIFIIVNSPDYAVDRCLASDAACDATASAYCQSKQFSAALSYRRIERDEITGVVPVSGTCGHYGCADFIAVECRR